MAVLSWDSKIEITEDEYTLLEPGKYPFKVTAFERTTVKNGKNAGKPQADYTLKVMDTVNNTSTNAHYRLILDTDYLWKISAFFKALGMVPKGATTSNDFEPDWQGAIGKFAMCEVTQNSYLKQDGSKGTSNNIERVWADPQESGANASSASSYGTL